MAPAASHSAVTRLYFCLLTGEPYAPSRTTLPLSVTDGLTTLHVQAVLWELTFSEFGQDRAPKRVENGTFRFRSGVSAALPHTAGALFLAVGVTRVEWAMRGSNPRPHGCDRRPAAINLCKYYTSVARDCNDIPRFSLRFA